MLVVYIYSIYDAMVPHLRSTCKSHNTLNFGFSEIKFQLIN